MNELRKEGMNKLCKRGRCSCINQLSKFERCFTSPVRVWDAKRENMDHDSSCHRQNFLYGLWLEPVKWWSKIPATGP